MITEHYSYLKNEKKVYYINWVRIYWHCVKKFFLKKDFKVYSIDNIIYNQKFKRLKQIKI